MSLMDDRPINGLGRIDLPVGDAEAAHNAEAPQR
jgi:hypothetical protein